LLSTLTVFFKLQSGGLVAAETADEVFDNPAFQRIFDPFYGRSRVLRSDRALLLHRLGPTPKAAQNRKTHHHRIAALLPHSG
jgi:hypothetical protein